ncbi:MAG: DNA-protecting protein DprA, partial [Bdellovibrionales bacterium]|nr:DNA-protecting protein DprA [Bdellovibrionales bacterium]
HQKREITWDDPEYPVALEPWQDGRFPVLYARGAPVPPHSSLVAVVGTRNPTLFGRRHAEKFARAITGAGLGIVSGLARGIDSLAHLHGLATYTVAVLGSAIDRIYPPEHTDLADMILERGGTILSPFPPGHETRPSNFVRRNALIAGLAAGTIVIEGDEKSGANTTGQAALDIERPCFTLLRDFDTPAGRGSMKLLDAGAQWTASPEQALAGIARPFGGKLQTLKEARIVPASEEFPLDEWIERFETVGDALQELERQILLGNVEALGHGRYRNCAVRKRRGQAALLLKNPATC